MSTARRVRDRRGRGVRGPDVLPAAYGGVASMPSRPTRRQRFDDLVLGVVTEIERRWKTHLEGVEYAVEDSPILPPEWGEEPAPLAVFSGNRLVVFRRPIEQRAADREELEAIVLTVIVEQIAEHLGIDAEDVDPRYRPE